MMQRTRITLTRNLDRTLASTSELEGIQAYLHKPPRLKGAQQPTQGQPPLLFIAPRAKLAVTPSLGILRADWMRWSQ